MELETRNTKHGDQNTNALGILSNNEEIAEEGSKLLTLPTKHFTVPIGEKPELTRQFGEVAFQNRGSHGALVKHPTTYLETLTHLLRGNIASGTFAMGDAFKNSGIAMAPWLIPLLGIMCVHSQHMLLNASDRMKKELKLDVNPDFAKTVELCFATGPERLRKYAIVMRRITNSFLCMTQLGICCVFFVFISTNLKQVCDMHGLETNIHVLMAIVLIPILLSCMVRNLKFLTPFYTVANTLMLVGISITLYYTTQDLPSLSARVTVADLRQFPLFFGTALYAFEGIALVLPLKNEMKRPQLFVKKLGVLNVGMTFVTFVFVLLGHMAYLKFGDTIQGSVTLNLPQDEILAQSVKIMISLGILFTFPLQFYIPIEIMFSALRERFGPFKNRIVAELSFRACFVIIIFVLAESIPFLDLFISLVGAVSSTSIGLLIPPLLELVTHWKISRITPWMALKDLCILVLGLLGAITGTFTSIELIVKAFSEGRA